MDEGNKQLCKLSILYSVTVLLTWHSGGMIIRELTRLYPNSLVTAYALLHSRVGSSGDNIE
jgi:hypothetical protein